MTTRTSEIEINMAPLPLQDQMAILLNNRGDRFTGGIVDVIAAEWASEFADKTDHGAHAAAMLACSYMDVGIWEPDIAGQLADDSVDADTFKAAVAEMAADTGESAAEIVYSVCDYVGDSTRSKPNAVDEDYKSPYDLETIKQYGAEFGWSD